MKNLTIISLKYSPGLLKEMMALSDAASLDNYKSNLLINNKYEWLTKEINYDPERVSFFSSFLGLLRELKKIPSSSSSKVIFYNFHPLNFILRFYKPTIKNFAYIHEPWMPSKHRYGIKRFIMVTLLERIQKLFAIFFSDTIVVPSSHAAEKALKFKMSKSGSNIQICPLMLDIEKETKLKENFFLFIGRLHGAKAFDSLLESLKHDSKINFKVLTTSIISDYILKKFSNELSNGRLKIIYKEHLSEQLIQSSISRSLGVFKLDTLMTQSGVVPLSFALSTPVIARDIKGFSQDINHKHDGFLIKNDNPESIIEAVKFVSDNNDLLSANARTKYENKFSLKSWSAGWKKVLDDKESEFNT